MSKDSNASPSPSTSKKPPLTPIDKIHVGFVGLMEEAVRLGLVDSDIAYAINMPVEAVRRCKKAIGIGPKDRLEECGLDKDKLRRMYVGGGMTMEQIAIQCECGVATVRRGLIKHGIPVQSAGKRKQVKLDEVRKMSEQGLDCDAIADSLKVSKASVQRVVRDQLDANEMNHLLWLDGITEEELARRMGVPLGPVRKFIRSKMSMPNVYWSLKDNQRPKYLKELYETTKHSRKYTIPEIARMFGLELDRLEKFLNGTKSEKKPEGDAVDVIN